MRSISMWARTNSGGTDLTAVDEHLAIAQEPDQEAAFVVAVVEPAFTGPDGGERTARPVSTRAAAAAPTRRSR